MQCSGSALLMCLLYCTKGVNVHRGFLTAVHLGLIIRHSKGFFDIVITQKDTVQLGLIVMKFERYSHVSDCCNTLVLRIAYTGRAW